TNNQAARPFSGGEGRLSLSGGLVQWQGTQSLQGVGQLGVNSATELRLRGVVLAGVDQGALRTGADVTITADQVAPASGTQYLLAAPGHTVTISGGDAAAAAPLSAAGAITIQAQVIEQGGVLRAPFGQISLQATDRLNLLPGSLTSVSGLGSTVPFGQTIGGIDWTVGAGTQLRNL
ncbi:MAG: hypothetical protein CFE45_40970, partial [Burkholderiales bacterium PBB5]